MLTFLSIFLLIYGSMHLYALGKVWMVFPHSYGLAVALVLAGIVLTFLPVLVWITERQGWVRIASAAAWVGYTWMGYLFLFFTIGLLCNIGQVLARLLNPDWPLKDVRLFPVVGLLALVLLVYGFIEARGIRVEEVTVTTPKLAGGKVTIAQISDLHLGIMNGDQLLGQVLAKLREIRPDMVVATGDIVDGQRDDVNVLARNFLSYVPPLGAFAVTGNHEYYAGLDESLSFLRNAGFSILRGESIRTGGIVLVGVDDHTARTPGQEARIDTSKALAAVSANDFIVLLKHQPIVNGDTRFDLQLSGHVHGGQIFPFGYLTRLAYGVHTGLTELADGRRLYVSRGTGTWGPPIRLFSAPEITLISIVGSNHQ